MICIISIFLLISTVFFPVKAQVRYNSPCGLLNNNIYCYWSANLVGRTEHEGAQLATLEIANANRVRMSTLANNWIVTTVETDTMEAESRQNSQYAAVDGKYLIISGGRNIDATARIVNQTIVYDIQTLSWKKYPDYEEPPYGSRQIFFAATTVVPGKGLAFYGGLEQHFNPAWAINTNQNLTATIFDAKIRSIGYIQVTYFNINNAINPWEITASPNTPSFFSSCQSSIYDPISAKIFYFGGYLDNTLLSGYESLKINEYHRFSYSMTFDTKTSIWENKTLGGNDTPSVRAHHTTTLLSNGESTTVLLYGGVGSYRELESDYCYTLDMTSYNWTRQKITNNTDMDLRRIWHSSVLVNNASLFIVGGYNSQLEATNTPIVLSISNPHDIAYMETYTDPSKKKSNSNVTKPRKDTKDTNQLTTSAIVGIAVGVTIAVILGISILVICLRKKKAQQKKLEQEIAELKHTSGNDGHEPIMEVNWDEIEKQYAGMAPGSKLTEAYRQPPDAITCIKPTLGEESTAIAASDTLGNPDSNNHISAATYSPNNFERPHPEQRTQKPDIGS